MNARLRSGLLAVALTTTAASAATEPAPVRETTYPDDPLLQGVDPSAPHQWAARALDLYRVEDATAPLDPVVVAVIDSGVDLLHPDLAPANQWRNAGETLDGRDEDGNGYVDDVLGWDFVDQDNLPWDESGHGTHVAGLIAATVNNGMGIAGANPAARLMALRVANFAGNAKSTAIASALHYAAANGARVANLSLGGVAITQAERAAIADAARRGMLVVVAAGNSASADAFGYAGLPGVLTVGAADASGERAAFSNGGVALDLIAPGVDLLSLRARGTDFLLMAGAAGYVAGAAFVDGGRYYRATGTSFAAALVSGVASRLLALRPTLTNVELARVLRQSARDVGAQGVDQRSGYGHLDFRAALAQDAAHWITARIARVSPELVDDTIVLDVLGQADADRFAGATLEVRAAGVEDWHAVGEHLGTPVGDGPLGRIDLGTLLAESGGVTRWQIRLVVHHADGGVREAWMDVELPIAAQAPGSQAGGAQ